MRLLKRNMTTFEYLPYTGEETDLNEFGEHTGEFQPAYGNAVSYSGNISIPTGVVNQMFYGLELRYTHVLVMDKPDVEIHENGVILWNGEKYDVKSVKRSINSFSAALKQQTNDHAKQEADDTPDDPETPDDSEESDGDGE